MKKTVLIALTGVLVSLILAADLITSSYLQASHSRYDLVSSSGTPVYEIDRKTGKV